MDRKNQNRKKVYKQWKEKKLRKRKGKKRHIEDFKQGKGYINPLKSDIKVEKETNRKI